MTQSKKLKKPGKSKPCSVCHGTGIFLVHIDVLDTLVRVERCDECGALPTDEDALAKLYVLVYGKGARQ